MASLQYSLVLLLWYNTPPFFPKNLVAVSADNARTQLCRCELYVTPQKIQKHIRSALDLLSVTMILFPRLGPSWRLWITLCG